MSCSERHLPKMTQLWKHEDSGSHENDYKKPCGSWWNNAFISWMWAMTWCKLSSFNTQQSQLPPISLGSFHEWSSVVPRTWGLAERTAFLVFLARSSLVRCSWEKSLNVSPAGILLNSMHAFCFSHVIDCTLAEHLGGQKCLRFGGNSVSFVYGEVDWSLRIFKQGLGLDWHSKSFWTPKSLGLEISSSSRATSRTLIWAPSWK